MSCNDFCAIGRSTSLWAFDWCEVCEPAIKLCILEFHLMHLDVLHIVLQYARVETWVRNVQQLVLSQCDLRPFVTIVENHTSKLFPAHRYVYPCQLDEMQQILSFIAHKTGVESRKLREHFERRVRLHNVRLEMSRINRSSLIDGIMFLNVDLQGSRTVSVDGKDLENLIQGIQELVNTHYCRPFLVRPRINHRKSAFLVFTNSWPISFYYSNGDKCTDDTVKSFGSRIELTSIHIQLMANHHFPAFKILSVIVAQPVSRPWSLYEARETTVVNA